MWMITPRILRAWSSCAVLLIVSAIPAACFAASASKCVSTKDACAAKHAATLLKCYAKAQKAGAVLDAACVAKADAKLESCFDKIESKQDEAKAETICRTSDDKLDIKALLHDFSLDAACTTNPLSCPGDTCAHSPCTQGSALSATCNACVADICAQDVFASCCTGSWDATCTAAVSSLCQIDCGAESPGPNTCAAAKTGCVNKRLAGVLKCYAKAQKSGTALDSACLQKVLEKFDGGADPTKGCFAKVEAKADPSDPATVCPESFDTAAAEDLADRASETLACNLDDDNCPCCHGNCPGPLVDAASHATVDAVSDIACGDVYVGRTGFNPPCDTTCGACSFGETCIEGACRAETRGRRCAASFPTPTCVLDLNNKCNILVTPFNPSTPNPALDYYFIDVDGYQDEPLWIHVRQSWDILEAYYQSPPSPLPTPSDNPLSKLTFFSCDDSQGRFYHPTSGQYGTRHDDYDASGTIADLVHLDSNTTLKLACKSFFDGPVVANGPLSIQDTDGQYYKFVPNPGVTGDHVAEFVIVVDDVVPGNPRMLSSTWPVTTLVYRINIRPRTQPIVAAAATEMPGTGHYYELVPALLPWDNAKANAAAREYNGMQGHLAVIGDTTENEFVRNLASSGGATSPVYIGLAQDPTPGVFSWVNGDPLVYSHWTAGVPDNSGGNETVVEMSPTTGEWNDQSLLTTHWYVVEYE